MFPFYARFRSAIARNVFDATPILSHESHRSPPSRWEKIPIGRLSVLFLQPHRLTTTGTVTGDGKRFLDAVLVGQSGPRQFTVVLNWQAGLKK